MWRMVPGTPSSTLKRWGFSMARPFVTFSPEQDAIIRSSTRDAAAQKLGLARATITRRRKELRVPTNRWTQKQLLDIEQGVNPGRPKYRKSLQMGLGRGYRWDLKDDDWLTNNPDVEDHVAARRLGRSVRAIQVRRAMLDVDRDPEATGMLTVKTASSLVGVLPNTLTRWVNHRKLKAAMVSGRLLVSPKDLRRFVLQYPERVNGKMTGDSLPMLLLLMAGKWG